MEILVAYATRHGATRGIAERIAQRLTAAGLTAEARPAAEVRDAARYDAFVVGGAAYMFHWLGDATTFVKRNATLLAERPTWLFSSGPIGTDTVDKDGRDVLETTVPKEFAGFRDADPSARREDLLRCDRSRRQADRDGRTADGAAAGRQERAAQG